MSENTAPTRTDTGLRVVKLEVERFKRIRAVEITPDPNSSTVTIAGRNAQGKSSVIDAIWAALSGAAAVKGTSTTRPIRDGENSARVTVDLGDIVVTRTWSGEKTALKVESKDGAKYSSPQRMLDEMVGRLSFDPLTFASLPAKDQQSELLGLVELPFDPAVLAGQRKSAFDERTDVGRTVKQLKGQLDGFPEIGDDVPDNPVSVAALVAELDTARELEVSIEVANDEIATARNILAETDRAISELREKENRWLEKLEETTARLAALPDRIDIEPIRSRIDNAETINAGVRRKQERQQVLDQLEDWREKQDALTARIAELDKKREDGLAAAEFPVPGLGFDEDGVTLDGVPFAQASAAEQLRVSVAMAMALNPKVRIIRITDGSLLDSENLALIEEMAGANGFQVWIERVDESSSVGVVIEDGEVKA
ncbi:AAA family ATPase [Rhodococcus sp. IEGM 1409]|uniref:AAA family ATPase n=1 Tax=Rhodococcus sp. IEGM 1409 TaxID=3047082 RepID=UPI0024B70748|nr:AAA family ATPase [Rhodococcus sp. IEGM 1409]MDI9898505.1 AAA family ATPase [Rhodococcus sp. IEGM 1409]